MHDGDDRRDSCHRRGDDFVARTNVQRAQAQFDRFHPVGYAGAEFRAAKFRPCFLEFLYLVSKDELT